MTPLELHRLLTGAAPDARAAAALGAVARVALDAAGERDDRPRLALATLDRWCAGGATRDELDAAVAESGAAREAAAREVLTAPHDRGLAAAWYAALAVQTALRRAAGDPLRDDGRGPAHGAVRCLEVCGEGAAAARARVENVLRASLADLLGGGAAGA